MQLKEESANGESSASSSASVTGSPAQEEEPPAKRFCHLSRLLDEKLKEGAKKASKKPQWEQQLENYTKAVHHRFQQHDDPIAFWTTEEVLRDYPNLAVIAIDLLIIPGSSAPVERTFSTAGHASSGKRNRLADKNLEREVLIRKNKQYL